MPRAQRKEQIKALEAVRERRVIAYVTGDRPPNLGAQIATDSLPLFYGLLSKLAASKPVPQLDVFIYSTGGITMAAWGLVALLREFADSLSILVPFRALSTATLIALGADEIVMGRLGQLSPVDPTVNSPYNPPSPQQQPGVAMQFLPVSVEDVRGFLDLARDEAELKEPSLIAEAFGKLASDVRPLALGNVNRAKQQIKILTEKLLRSHKPGADQNRIDSIVETFTRKLYSHDYLIGRKEARKIIGNEVVDAPPKVEEAMWALYSSYADDLELIKPFNVEAALGSTNQKVVQLRRAYIESSEGCHVFKTTLELRRTQVKHEGTQTFIVQPRVLDEGWTSEDS